jgi:hypothetical protein
MGVLGSFFAAWLALEALRRADDMLGNFTQEVRGWCKQQVCGARMRRFRIRVSHCNRLHRTQLQMPPPPPLHPLLCFFLLPPHDAQELEDRRAVSLSLAAWPACPVILMCWAWLVSPFPWCFGPASLPPSFSLPLRVEVCVGCVMHCVRGQAWTVSLIGWTVQHAVLKAQAQPGRIEW